MTTSVFISDETVAAVCASETGKSFKITGCTRRDVPPGTITAGRIADGERFRELLRDLFTVRGIEKSDVTLVLDATMTQIMDVPIVSPARIRRLVANEFEAQYGAGIPLLCDYCVINGATSSAGGRIIGCAVERETVEKYMETFGSLGIKLRSATVAVQSILHLSSFLNARIARRTFVLSLLYGRRMISYLFNAGEYTVMVHNTMMQDRGSAAAAVELSRNLSALSQYNAAQQESLRIETVYVTGMQGQELGYCGEISANLNVGVEQLKSVFKVKGGSRLEELFNHGDYIYCLGDILRVD